jgi:hypothetical protein
MMMMRRMTQWMGHEKKVREHSKRQQHSNREIREEGTADVMTAVAEPIVCGLSASTSSPLL